MAQQPEEVLELSLRVTTRTAVECARHLRSQIRATHWPILAALAAEVVSIHESTAAGKQVLVVEATPEEAKRILQGRA